MQFSTLALLSLTVLSATTALPSTRELNLKSLEVRSLSECDLAFQRLMDRENVLDIVALAERISTLAKRTVQRRFAMASPGGNGGGGKSSLKSGPGGGGSGGDAQPPPGLSAEGKKAWDQCQAAQKSKGDCSATKGPLAEMGCSLGSLQSSKPCENKDLQAALSRVRDV